MSFWNYFSEGLEQHFQQNKELFKKFGTFHELLRENQNNKILLAWKARFEYQIQ